MVIGQSQWRQHADFNLAVAGDRFHRAAA
jgi:hypothetical protein